MILAYVITMPNVGSWNGKWTGEKNLYARTFYYRKNTRVENAKKILQRAPYYFRWDDGWTACIQVKEVDLKEKRKIDKNTKGFIGYDWMIDSIEIDQTIKYKSDR